MKQLTFALSIFCVATCQLFCVAICQANDAPNFVVILADDQGWNSLSVPMDPHDPGSGSTYYQTPNLAKLAAEGMRFSQAYAPAPTCSPTRHSIQFGRSPSSLKIWGADNVASLDASNEESLPHLLKAVNADYVCAHLGKWHISRKPKELGYDVHDGDTTNREGKLKNYGDDPKQIYSMSRRANGFIKQQVEADNPFFLQISHYADHLDFQAKSDTIEKYKTQHGDKATAYQNSPLWAAMNENLDEGIGMVLDQIDDLGIADNTYVIYTADNGYESKEDFGKPVHERGFYKAFPQRSHKYHVSEGGIRVPFIVRGPSVPAGTHSATPVIGTDILPTVIDLAGGLAGIPKTVEGGSLVAHLQSSGKKRIDRKDPFFVFKHTKATVPHDIAIVQGNYKLIKDIDTNRIFLFNLKNDIGERESLTQAEPKRTEQMYAEMSEYFQRFGWDESQISNSQNPERKKRRSDRLKN